MELFFIEILSFSIVFLSHTKSLHFECYATMPMLAYAHISSLGYLCCVVIKLMLSRVFSLCVKLDY